ncbi:hypothetical protein H4R20_002765, partial [Coemansia guatemalensis]
LAFAAAVATLLSIQGVTANSKCHPTACYEEYVGPLDCKPDEPCPAIALLADICPWECGKPVPESCAERCKPCKEEVCPEICVCEKVCLK